MATNSRTFEVKFVGDIKGLKGSINDLQKEAGKLGKSFTGVSGVMKGALGALSFVGIAAGFKSIINGSKEAASDINRLRHILINASGATNKQVDALLAEADALSKVGVASKAHIIAAQSQLATFNLQASTIKTLTPAILNYVLAERGAAATIDDVKQMTNGLALALDGQFASLTRVGFVMDKATKDTIKYGSESERAAAIVEVLDSTYKGFNESLAKTPEGQVILLNRAMSDLKDTIGAALLPAFVDLVDVFTKQIMPIIKAFVDGLVGNKSVVSALDESGKKAWAWGYTVLGIFKTIVAMKDQILKVGAALVVMWSVAKVAAAAGSIYKIIEKIIKVYEVLSKVAHGATIAQALATGGVSLVAAAGAAAAAGVIITGALYATNKAVDKFNKTMGEMPSFADVVPPDFTGVLDDMGGGFERVSEDGKKAAAATKALNDQIAKFKDMLGNANKVLEDAKNKFNEYAKSISDTFKSIINFRDAFGKSQESIQNAEDSLKKLAEAQYRYQASLGTDDIEAQQQALIDLMTAQQEATNSVTNKKTFLETLQDQASKAQEFAKKVQQLITMGLSETAIQQVLNAGADAGSAIADEIIAGGATIVDKVNSLLEATASVADQVGQYGAEQFYRAGITQGEALVRGILDAIAAAGLTVDATGNITGPQVATGGTTGGGGGGGGGGTAKTKPKTPLELQAGRIANKLSRIPMMAAGGIVDKPTLAMIGEAGPEAVVPLNRMPGGNKTYNITVNAGMGTNGALVGKEIVDAIKRYERSSGPVFASV